MTEKARQLRDILKQFDLVGDVSSIVPCSIGHINDTFIAASRAGAQERRYTLQRINGAVFEHPERIMHNIGMVSGAIGGDNDDAEVGAGFRALTLVLTRQGQLFHRDQDGHCWRCYNYVPGVTYSCLPEGRLGTAVAYEAAAAFGRFDEHLGRLDAGSLHVTIEDFHNTPVRLQRFRQAAGSDPHGRAGDAVREIAFAVSRQALAGAIAGPLERGHIPLRAAHNDTKINNVIFDDGEKSSPKALCVIDLDTVMPGSPLFDFGDLVRSSVCRRPEDETDLDTVRADPAIFEALVAGFCARPGSGVSLTQSERELLVTACLVITFETGVRFLTDYLMGDVYFRTGRTGHNLDRARAQFRLLADMETKRDKLEHIVKETAQWQR